MDRESRPADANREADTDHETDTGREANGDRQSGTDWTAVLAGAGVDAAVAVLAVVLALPESARWPAFAAVAAAGLVGGHLTGRLAGGSWRRRTRHGLLAGLLGGAALAGATWWSLQPGSTDGPLWPANFLLAIVAGRLPSAVAAEYDALLGVVAAVAFGAVYVAEGAVAGGAAPGSADAVALRE